MSNFIPRSWIFNWISNYFIGNGAALTGIVASGGAAITNGSSNVSIGGAGANVTVGVAGVGNVAVFSSTDLTISGNLLPAGNVSKNIGSPTNAFNDLYLANSTIFLGNATISANATSVVMTNESGQQTRSFLFIDECLEAVERLMNSDFMEPVNIGSEEMVTINQLAQMTIDLSQKNVKIDNLYGDEFLNKYGFKCPLGVKGRKSDNKLFREKIGWEPFKLLID